MLAMKLEMNVSTVIGINGEVIKDMKKIFKGHKKSKIEVFNHLLVEMNEKDQMVVSYITNEITVQKVYEVQDVTVNGYSSFTLPIATLKDMKHVKNGEQFIFEVESHEKIVIIRDGIEYPVYPMAFNSDFGNVNHSLYGLQYEEVETKEEGNNLLNRTDIEQFIKAGISVSTSETRPILTALCVRNGEVISTDSHRLFKGETILDVKDMVIPVGIFKKAKELSDKNDLFTLFVGENGTVKLTGNKLTIVERTVQGNFPQIDRLLPTDFKLEFKIEKIHQVKTVVESVKNGQVEMVYNKEKREIDLAIRNYEVVTIAKNKTERKLNKEVKATIPVQVMNDSSIDNGFKITFSGQYFLESLKQMEMEYINVRIVANLRPFIVDNDKNKDMALILPIRTY